MLEIGLAHKRTIAWIVGGALFFAVVAGVAYGTWPSSHPPASAEERVTAALRLMKWPAAVTLAMIMSLFRVFYDRETLNPLAGKESARHRINQRVLTNTVEHLAVFVPAACALAAGADSPTTWRFVPMAVALFTAGRVLFWLGYHITPNARGFGFNLSFSTVVATTVGAFILA